MRIKLITCASFAPALVSAIARSKNIIHTEILQTIPEIEDTDCYGQKIDGVCAINNDGLNLCSENCQGKLLEFKIKLDGLISETEEHGYNALLLLIDNRHRAFLSGLKANRIPIVVPRNTFIHNNAGIQHGDNQRINDYFDNNKMGDQVSNTTSLDSAGIISLIEKLNGIKNGVEKNTTALLDFWEKLSELEAEWFGWDFERVDHDYLLLQRFVDGFWSYDEFVVLMPGDQLIIDSEIGNIALKKNF